MTDGDGLSITALFAATSPHHRAQYRVLAQEHPDVDFVEEAEFKADTLRLLAGSPNVLLLVDDTIVTGPFSLGNVCGLLASRPSALGFSLRLGRNTTYCYAQDVPQAIPNFTNLGRGVLSYRWPGADADFGYPLEVSSSLYRASDILPLVERLEFRNPNTLEAALAAVAGAFESTLDELLCYETSVAFSAPVNIVQGAWSNRSGGREGDSAASLAERFSRGERMAIERFDGYRPRACHEEVELHFTRDATIPTVSVVIPCYGQAQYLPNAVESVVAQTFIDWEIIIVDDGSPDDTADVAAALAAAHPDRAIRLVRRANGGAPAARNSGVATARGTYVLPLDADDLIEPTMLAEMLALLENDPTIAFVYTDAIHFDGTSAKLVPAADYDPGMMPFVNQPNYCSLFPRYLWEEVGGFNEEMRLGYEDWDFWLSLAERGWYGQRLPKPLFRYRVRPDGLFSTALAHDTELRSIIRRNHPRLFGRREIAARRVRRFRETARWAVRSVLRSWRR